MPSFFASRWLRRLTRGSRPSRASALSRWSKPQLEALESLTLLSTLDIVSAGGTLGNNLTYTASDAVDNNLTISLTGGSPATLYQFTDTGETITLTQGAIDAGWTGSGANTVTGPISSVNNSFTVDLLTGADALNVNGAVNVLSQVVLKSGQDITFGAAGSSSSAAASLTATAGAISQTAGASIVATSLALQASTGIGSSATPLATGSGLLAAESSTGGVFIVNNAQQPGPVSVVHFPGGPTGVRVTSDSGDVSLTNNGTIFVTTDGDTIRGPDNVTVNAIGETADIVTGGQATSGLAAIRVPGGGSGNVLVQAGRDIIAGSSGAAGSIGAESGDVTLIAGRNITVDLGSAVGSLSATVTTAGLVTLQAGGDILVDNGAVVGDIGAKSTEDGGLLVTADGNITVDHGSALGNPFTTATSTNNLVVTAGGNVVVNNNSFVGDLSTSSLSVTAGTAGTGSISVLAGSSINTAGGDLSLTTSEGGVFTLSGHSTVDSTTDSAPSGLIAISADDIVIDTAAPASTISAANTGNVVLRQAGTTARPIDLGGGTAPDALGISDAELGQITAGVLVIGSPENPGDITVTAPVTSHAGYAVLSLVSGGGISEAAGATITVSQLALEASNAIELGNDNVVSAALGAFVFGLGQEFVFTQAAGTPLVIGTVDGVQGIATNDGQILVTTSADLQVTSAIVAGSAQISLRVGGADNLFKNTATITNGGDNPIQISADRMDLKAVITNTNNGRVTLSAPDASRPIDLGSTDDPNGSLNLSDDELNQIQTGGVLQVGDTTAGDILISTTIFPASIFALSLKTGGGITQTAGTHITVPALAVTAVNNVVLDQGNNIGEALAASVTGDGKSLTFTQGFDTTLTIDTVDLLDGINVASGSVTLTAPSIDLVGDITSGKDQTFAAPVTLSDDITLISTDNGNITFTSTLQSPGVPFDLTLDAGGIITFAGEVGGDGNTLGTLTVAAGGSTQINGGGVNTSDFDQIYNNVVTLGKTFTLLAGDVFFTGHLILGVTATTATSTMQVAGTLHFADTASLTTTFAGTTPDKIGHIIVSNLTDFSQATLDLNYSGGFTPAPGDSFDVVSNGAFSVGQFDNVPAPGPVTLNGTLFAVTYSGSDGGSDFILTVATPPAITSPNHVAFSIFGEGTFTVTASGDPAPTFQISGALPPGVTFDSSTGELSGTPTAFGVFPLTFTASNGVSPDATQPFTLTVSGIPAYATTLNQRFVAQVYLDLLGRFVEQSALTFWSGQIDQGASRSQVVLSIELDGSNEFRTLEVENLYQRYLQRQADPGGLASSVSFLASGGTIQQLAAILTGSDEFFQKAGGTNTGFLQQLYLTVLGRPIDPQALAVDLVLLANGFGRTPLSLFVTTSAEASRGLVEVIYQLFLHRAADPGGLDYFTQQLLTGTTFEQVVASVIGSQEFLERDVGQ